MTFDGWPDDAFSFYDELSADNSKAFWTANRHRYESNVRAPLEWACEALAADFGEFHIFRPYTDARFSKNKRPYKEHQGAVATDASGIMRYLSLSAEGLLTGIGMHQMGRDQLARFYRAIDDESTGTELVALVHNVSEPAKVEGSELKTAPKGYKRDHPRIELLRHKGLTVTTQHGRASWVSTPDALRHIAASWAAADQITLWLSSHVGPSDEPFPWGR